MTLRLVDRIMRPIDRGAARILNSQHPLWKKLDRVGAKLFPDAADALDGRTLAALGAGGPKVTVADLTHLMAAGALPPPPPPRRGAPVPPVPDPHATQMLPRGLEPPLPNHPETLLNKALGIKPSPRIKLVYAFAGLATLGTLLTPAAPAVLIIALPLFVVAGAVHTIYRLAQNIRASMAWEKLASVTRGNPGNIQILAARLKDRSNAMAMAIVSKLNDTHLMADVLHAIAWLKLPEANRAASGILDDPLFKTYSDAAVLNSDLAKLRAMKTARGIAGDAIFEATVQARIERLSARPGAQQVSQTSTVTLLSDPANHEADLDQIRRRAVSLGLSGEDIGVLLGRANTIRTSNPALEAKARAAMDVLYTLLTSQGGRGNA